MFDRVFREHIANLFLSCNTNVKGLANVLLIIICALSCRSRIDVQENTAQCFQTLGQESIREKTNEIPIFQGMLNIEKTITADARHCQRETCIAPLLNSSTLSDLILQFRTYKNSKDFQE